MSVNGFIHAVHVHDLFFIKAGKTVINYKYYFCDIRYSFKLFCDYFIVLKLISRTMKCVNDHSLGSAI